LKYGRVYNSDAIDVFVVVKNGAIGLKSGIMKLKQRGNKQNKKYVSCSLESMTRLALEVLKCQNLFNIEKKKIQKLSILID